MTTTVGTQQALATGDEPSVVQLPTLIAPLRFGTVAQIVASHSNVATSVATQTQQTVYKGSLPRERHLPFLRRLHLKTILSLTPKPLESIDPTISQWTLQESVRAVHVHCDKPKDDGGGLSKEAAMKAIMLIFDSRNLPIYVHCLDGQIISSLLVAIIRKIQAWSTTSIADEMSRMLGHDEEIMTYQLGFLDKFGKSDGVRLPSRRHIPEWAWMDPSPLKRLKDPYDVIVPKDKSSEKPNPNHDPTPTNTTPYHHRRQFSVDGTGPNSPGTLSPVLGVGLLPVNHPSLRLRFDPDPDLPPPHSHSRDSSIFSPSSSRPSSRAGRSPHTHSAFTHHASNLGAGEGRTHSYTGSLPGSPRRRSGILELRRVGTEADQNSSLSSPATSEHMDLLNTSNSSLSRAEEAVHVDRPTTPSLSVTDEDNVLRSADTYPMVPDVDDVFSLSTPTPSKTHHASNTITPRASFVRPVRPTRSASPKGESVLPGERSQNGRHDTLAEPFLEPSTKLSPLREATLFHSTSLSPEGHSPLESGKLASSGDDSRHRSSSDHSQTDLDYYSDPEHTEEHGKSPRHRRNTTVSEGHSHASFDSNEDSDSRSRYREGSDDASNKGEEEVMEEEEEEEEIEEEEDEEEEQDEDDLALEALDLEGY